MSVLEKVRQWIDGDSAERVLEQAARDAQVKPRSRAEEFIVKIARAVEGVMQAEMVPLPQGTTIIPSEYTIFLNEEDDKEWQGIKRKGLEQGLYHILGERAKEIAGRKKLETKSFVIELRIDATLPKGDVRVAHSWEETVANKTTVLSRSKPLVAEPDVSTGRNISPLTAKPRDLRSFGSDEPSPANFQHKDIQQAEPLANADREEMTQVKSRMPELYRLEVWRNNIRQNIFPVFQREIVIGRGSKTKPVDIPLSGDVEISRRHLTLITDGAGNFWAFNEGKNAAEINNAALPSGKRVPVPVGVPIDMCSYTLCILPN